MKYTHSLSEAKIKFAKGPRRWMLEEVILWIKQNQGERDNSHGV